MKHSAIGASGISRIIACPGSVNASRGMPDKETVYAAEGTAAHALAEWCLRNNEDPAHRYGNEIPGKGRVFTVTEEMVEAVRVYRKTILSDREGLINPEMFIEKRIRLNWLRNDLFGTADCVLIEDFGRAIVYDFKYGAGVPVEAEANPQGMYYALGAVHGMAVEEIEIVIVQPRAFHQDGPVRRWTTTIDELEKWGTDVLLMAANASDDPNATRHAGDHCRFCKALSICDEARRRTIEAARMQFDDDALPVPLQTTPSPENFTNEQIKRALEFEPVAMAMFKAIREEARERLERGEREGMGYKLVHGRATRKWTDDLEAEKALVNKLEEEAYQTKLLTPAQAEKALKATGMCKKEVDAYLEEHIEISKGITLAPEGDKRPEVEIRPAIEDVFDDEVF